MNELLALGQKLSAISFPVLLFLILVGSYYETWVWGRQYRELKAENEEWKQMALRITGVAEVSVQNQATRVKR